MSLQIEVNIRRLEERVSNLENAVKNLCAQSERPPVESNAEVVSSKPRRGRPPKIAVAVHD